METSITSPLSTPTLPGTISERIKELLGQGLPASVVANTVGCDPSYISQLMETEDFKNAVLLARAGKAEALVKKDNLWDSIEQRSLEKVEELMQWVQRPQELARLAAIANAAKRRATEFASGGESAAPVVQLILPQSAAVHFKMSVDSQVVEVEGRSMAALPTKHLTNLLKEKEAEGKLNGVLTTMVEDITKKKELTSLTDQTERKKVVSILEQIGYAEETVPVAKVLP